MKTVLVHRASNPGGLVATVKHAHDFISRLLGLLGTKQLSEHDGLLITPCRTIHTLGMRLPLDIVFLDANGMVLKCVSHLAPCRIATARGATHTLELAAGRVAQLRLHPGERLRWDIETTAKREH